MASSIDKLAKELKKQINASDERKPKPYDTQAEVLRVENGVAWVHIPGGVDETPVRLTINAKKGDNVNLHVANGTAWITGNSTNPPTDDSTANYAVNISNEVKKEVTVLHTTVVDVIEATDARFETVEADTAKIHTLTAEKILATVGYIDDLTAEEITVQDLTAASGYIKDLEADNITAQDISAATGYIGDLTAGNVTAQNVIADHATVGSLDTNYAHITNGVIDNAKIGYADVDGLNANYAHISNGTIDNAKIDQADVNNLNANYAQINLANVNNAWIENGLIKDAAISDAQILGVSANKLTAGTIDASNITVTNLNASNITTGSITVDGITIDVENNEASIDGSYIEDGTITMNGFSQEVKDVIDGAIETFTGTVVPTLNNAPASSWTTTKLKDQHVGDVYYVVNSSSKQNGYCYRFSKSGSTYSWQLIKDSDVTAALSRLTTAEGKIGDIEEFDEEIATFKTETEGEISTLQTKTTSLETSLGDKVDVSTFNTLSQTVDGNSASITTLTTTTQTLREDLDGLEIGGRNLLRHTESPTTDDLAMARSTIEDGGIIRTTSTTSTSGAKFKVTYLDYKDYNGKTLTVSADVRLAPVESEYTVTTARIYIGVNSASRLSSMFGSTYDRYGFKVFHPTSNWTRISFTAKIPDDLTLGTTDALVDTNQITVEVYSLGSTKPVDWKNIKLEIGNKATDWTPAPEDMEETVTTISNTVNTVSQTATSNSSYISQLTTTLGTNADGTTKTGDIMHRTSDIEQDLDGITTRVSKTEVKIAGQYATSSTAAGTKAKVATITPAVTDWELYAGATVTVKFSTANTHATPTLNVNSTGAKNIKGYKGAALTEAEYKWAVNDAITFVYDGTNWLMQNSSTSATRLSTAETTISQTANNVLIKATESDTTAAQGGQHLIQSLINVAPSGVTIDASKVNITGVITAINDDTTTTIDGDKITTGSITAEQIKAYSIGASQIVISDSTNLAVANEAYEGSLPTAFSNIYKAAIIDGYLTKKTATQQYLMLTDYTPSSFKGGDELYYEFYGKAEAAGNITLRVWGYKGEGSSRSGSMNSSVTIALTTTEAFYSGTITLTDTSTNLWSDRTQYLLGFNDARSTKSQIYVRKCVIRRKNGGELIVDGSVKASAIDADSGTFNTANIPNLSAGKITSGTLDASKVTVTNLDAGSITAGDIAAARMKVNSIAAINSLTTGKIDADRLNVGQITVGDLSDGSSYSTTTQMNTAINNAVDDVAVGGRNLILNTVRQRTGTSASNSVYVSPKPTLSEYGQSILTNTTDEFTYSFDYEITGNSSTTSQICVQAKGSIVSGSALKTSGNASGHYSHTFKLNDTQVASTTTTMRIRMQNATDGAIITVKNIKLEKGNKETDWSSAPEDYITDIDGTGIRIHPASTENNSVVINASGMEVFQGGTGTANSVAFYGDITRVGKEVADNTRIVLEHGATSGGMRIIWRDHSGTKDATITDIGYTSGLNYDGAMSVAPYASLGQRGNTTNIGNYSIAEGYGNTASAYASHAEGYDTTASGLASHAEGSGTVASKAGAHAEGGDSTASGQHSHAGGTHSTASGDYSFAGNEYTIASGTAQTAIGKYNKSDTSSLFIIGNGSSSARSNALTVDGSANVTIKQGGELRLNGDSQSSSSSSFSWTGLYSQSSGGTDNLHISADGNMTFYVGTTTSSPTKRMTIDYDNVNIVKDLEVQGNYKGGHSKTTFTPAHGTNYSTYGGSYYEKFGHVVHVHVGVSGLTASTDYVVTTLPAGYRPSSTVFAHGTGGAWNNISYMDVRTDGAVHVRSQGAYCGADVTFMVE